MSLLWSRQRQKKQLTKQMKPSPTYQSNFSDSARNLKTSLDGGYGCPSVISCFIKGTSLLTSLLRETKAGMTVEASIALPLFLFFFLNLGCAIEMIRLHGNIQLALWQAGNKLAIYGYALDSNEKPKGGASDDWWKGLSGIALTDTYVRGQIINSAGAEYLNQSPLKNGINSLQFWESDVFGEEDEIDIIVTYSVSPWSNLIGFSSFRMANRYYSHVWNGYGLQGDDRESSEEAVIVYVTETGRVYHNTEGCSHLRLSAQPVSASEIDGIRNQGGGRYYPCEKCADGTLPMLLYITNEGNRYHFTRACSGLKRTVNAIPLDAAKQAGYTPCSRCGQ